MGYIHIWAKIEKGTSPQDLSSLVAGRVGEKFFKNMKFIQYSNVCGGHIEHRNVSYPVGASLQI